MWFAITLILLSISAIAFAVWDKELAPAVPGFGVLLAGVFLMVRAYTSGNGFGIRVMRPTITEARTILTEQRAELKASIEELDAEVRRNCR